MLRIDPLDSSTTTRTIAFSFDDRYAKYFSVALLSLAAHARADLHYDIVVFHDSVSQRNISMLQSLAPENFTLRFFNVGETARGLFGDLNGKISLASWDIATFYDLLVPLLMPAYERVLFCDSDLVFCDSPDELFTMPFDGAPLIAVQDSLSTTWQLSPDQRFLANQVDFITSSLGLSDLQHYFNGGVLVFNIGAIDTQRYLQRAKEALSLPELPTVDQEVLNHIFADEAKLAPRRFNVQAHLGDYLREEGVPPCLHEFREAAESPVIVHYTTPKKPWAYPDCFLAERFWSQARESPYYEEIVYANTLELQRRASAEYTFGRYVKYGILSKVVPGSRRAIYQAAFERQKKYRAVGKPTA